MTILDFPRSLTVVPQYRASDQAVWATIGACNSACLWHSIFYQFGTSAFGEKYTLYRALSIANEVVPVIFIWNTAHLDTLRGVPERTEERCEWVPLYCVPKVLRVGTAEPPWWRISTPIWILLRQVILRHPPAPAFYLRVTSAFGEKHCIAVSALQGWPFNLQRQRALLS